MLAGCSEMLLEELGVCRGRVFLVSQATLHASSPSLIQQLDFGFDLANRYVPVRG